MTPVERNYTKVTWLSESLLHAAKKVFNVTGSSLSFDKDCLEG